jgi:hypothetical protein
MVDNVNAAPVDEDSDRSTTAQAGTTRGIFSLAYLPTAAKRTRELTLCRLNLLKYMQRVRCKTGAFCWLFVAPTIPSSEEGASLDDVNWSKARIMFTHGTSEWESLRAIARAFNPRLRGLHTLGYSRGVDAAHSTLDEEVMDVRAFFDVLEGLLGRFFASSYEETWVGLCGRIRSGVLNAKGAMRIVKEGIRVMLLDT